MKTTIQISENLRQRLKLLAAYRNVSYEELLEELVNCYENAIKKNIDGSKISDLMEELIKRNQTVKKK